MLPTLGFPLSWCVFNHTSDMTPRLETTIWITQREDYTFYFIIE